MANLTSLIVDATSFPHFVHFITIEFKGCNIAGFFHILEILSNPRRVIIVKFDNFFLA